jgi:hypothetical protein
VRIPDHLKAEIESGKPHGLYALLDDLHTAVDLQSVKEQKLLFKTRDRAQREQAIEQYRKAARRILGEDAETELNYADFVSHLASFYELHIPTRETADQFECLSASQKLKLCNKYMDLLMSQLESDYDKDKIGQRDSLQGNHAQMSATFEEILHSRNGDCNDGAWAIARAFNYVSGIRKDRAQSTASKMQLESARIAFSKLVNEAGLLNGIDYIIDKISYGEWYVKEALEADTKLFKLAISNIQQEKAKILGIRRHLSNKMRPRKTLRFIQTAFMPFAEDVFSIALRHYTESQVTELREVDRIRIELILSMLSHEDELLLSITDRDLDIFTAYLVAISLRISMIAGYSLRESSNKTERAKFHTLGVPFTLLRSCFKGWDIPPEILKRTIERYIEKIPRRNYFSLIEKPFFLCEENKISAIRLLANGDWAAAIRSSSIRGGQAGENFGKSWEESCAQTFREFGWKVASRGIKLKRNGKTLTDIDIIAFKSGLLLLVQLKAIGTEASSVYNQWKIREIIKKGASQARIASEFLSENKTWMKSFLSANHITCPDPTIQPLVLTSSSIFTGLIINEIPVLGYGDLLSLLRGANVNYVDEKGNIKSSKKLAKSSPLTSDEFLDFLQFPIGWRIAGEHQCIYKTLELPDLKVMLPEIKLVPEPLPERT